MTDNNEQRILDNEELELLSEMMLATDETDDRDLEYNVNSSAKGESLLLQLGSANKLQLFANYGNHHLVFPVQVENGDFANLKMTLRAPEIFETGKTRRAWRLATNDKKIFLVNKAGGQQHFQIEDLSASGISFLIDPETQSEFPETLDDAFIQLPNRERLAVSGLHISRVDERVVAYSLGEGVEQSVLTALYEYLFECHAEQYPEAHKNYPV